MHPQNTPRRREETAKQVQKKNSLSAGMDQYQLMVFLARIRSYRPLRTSVWATMAFDRERARARGSTSRLRRVADWTTRADREEARARIASRREPNRNAAGDTLPLARRNDLREVVQEGGKRSRSFQLRRPSQRVQRPRGLVEGPRSATLVSAGERDQGGSVRRHRNASTRGESVP